MNVTILYKEEDIGNVITLRFFFYNKKYDVLKSYGNKVLVL